MRESDRYLVSFPDHPKARSNVWEPSLSYVEQLSKMQAAAGQSLPIVLWQCSKAGGGCVAVGGERERARKRT